MKFKRVYIELSNYCNLNCIFCTPKNKKSRMMSLSDYKKVLDNVVGLTNEVCLHVLGEPLMHKDFNEIVAYTLSKNINIMLSTNSRLIVPKKQELLNLYIKTWNLSLHSAYTIDSQDEYILSILKFIDEYQKKYEATFHLRLWAESNKTIKKSNNKIRNILFKYYQYDGKVTSRIRLKERVILSYEDEFEWPTLQGEESEGFCLGGKTHIAVLANGDVVMCCLDASGHTKLGNAFVESIESILGRNPYLDAIKEFRNNHCYFSLCKHCSYKNRRL